MLKQKINVFWFRRDLRIEDNNALYQALRLKLNVLPIFIFDKDILDKLEDSNDKRIQFIHSVLTSLKSKFQKVGSDILVKFGRPIEVFADLVNEFEIDSVFVNHDYEPYAQLRDQEIEQFLNFNSVTFNSFKDQVVFERQEIVKDDGLPYTVFTPYSKKWKSKISDEYVRSFPSESQFDKLLSLPPINIFPLEYIGFSTKSLNFQEPKIDLNLIKQYTEQRDFPILNGTTRLSIHLRFGTVSIRSLVKIALQTNETWLNELIWREFYMCILYHFPNVVKSAFKPKYDKIEWRNNEIEFQAWCDGLTGYPIVDAGMRELNETGFMHNRVRMIVASFLTKHLLIDWRWGEAYFASKLLDFDLSANNGGWQWAAGCGCDAAPYFRIFNPYEQTRKFDSDLKYIRKWVPEFEEFYYPKPIVEHKFARDRALSVYKVALQP